MTKAPLMDYPAYLDIASTGTAPDQARVAFWVSGKPAIATWGGEPSADGKFEPGWSFEPADLFFYPALNAPFDKLEHAVKTACSKYSWAAQDWPRERFQEAMHSAVSEAAAEAVMQITNDAMEALQDHLAVYESQLAHTLHREPIEVSAGDGFWDRVLRMLRSGRGDGGAS